MACNDRNSTDAKCIKYTGGRLDCSGINKNDPLDIILTKIDDAICSSGGGGSLSSVGIDSTDLVVTNSPLTSNGNIGLSIANRAVSYAKMQNANPKTILGRYSPISGVIQEIAVGSGLSLSDGGILSAMSGGTVTSVGLLSSDITVSGTSPITSSGTFTLSLPNINSNVGTFNNITINAKGQAIAGSNISYLTTNETITLSGAVSGSGTTAITTSIADNSIAYSKLAQTSGAVVLGSNSAGNVSQITISTGLNFSGSNLIVQANTTNQKVQVLSEGSSIGTRKAINLISGANTTITATDDSVNDRINITIDSAGGGGGGGTPGGSDGQLQYNNSSSFGGTISGVYSASGDLFTYTAQVATDVPLVIKGAPSQSASLQRWVNSSGTLLASISANGIIAGANLSGTNTGDQTITLTGDVTGSGTGSFTATIPNDTITYAKLQNISASRLLGRYTASSGDAQEISIGSGLTLNSSTGVLSSSAFGTVTSVGISGANGISVSGSPITSSGTIALSLTNITPSTVNGLTLTALATGFSIAGGTASRTLTVSGNANVSGTNTGDVSLSGQNYLSISGQAITVSAVNLSGSNVTGTLAAARMPALTGDVTSTAGSVATSISNGAVTYSKIQDITAQKLVGRYSASSGVMQEITLGSGLTLDTSTGTLSATGGGGGGGTCFDTLSTFMGAPNSTITGTNYISLNGDSFSTNASDKVIVIPSSGYIKNLFVIASGNQGASTLTFTLMKSSTNIAGLSNTSLSLTIPASTNTGTGTVYSDTANSVAVSAGDILVLKAVSSSLSAKILGVSMLFTNQ